MVIVQRDSTPPSRLKTFFNPIFSFLPFNSGRSTFKLWPGGAQAQGPVNMSRSYGEINITPEIALQLSAVWACVWRYANTISTLPFHVLRSTDGVSAKMAREHPLYVVLHDQPNSQMSAVKFWQSMVASMMMWGVCYARKNKIGTRVVSLTPLRPEYMTAYMNADGEMRYRYWPGQPEDNEDFSADELFVIIDRSMDGYTGLSRIQYAANSLGMAIAGDRAASLTWKNGLRLSGILTIAQWLKPEQRAAYKRIVNEFVGTGTGTSADKQFGVMVAENATKFEPISMNPHDVELLSSRKFSIEDVCRWYDTPPVLIGHSAEGQTMWGTGVEQIILGWLKMGLAPVLRTIESEVWRQLISPQDRGLGYYAEFNLDALLRGDSAARAAFYSQMSQNGIYTRNEIRSKENLPPMDGGDRLTVQSAMVPLDRLDSIVDSNARKPSNEPVPVQKAVDISVSADPSLRDEIQQMNSLISEMASRPPAQWRQVPVRDESGRIKHVNFFQEK